MIEVKGISKSYGKVEALRSVSLEINKGEALGLVGPNGSGKSTLLRIILGIIKPTEGSVLVDGRELVSKDWKEFRRRLGYMPERISFYDNLTGLETLQLFARVKGVGKSRAQDVADGIITKDVLKRKVGQYSKGMLQRLNLAQALLGDPDLLVLDEPTSGLDPDGIMEFYRVINEAREKRDLTVILSSHILAEIENRITKVAVMKAGELKAIGKLEELYSKLDLPLNMIITLTKKDKSLEEELIKAGVIDISYRNGYLIANVPRDKKLKVLSSAMAREECFKDISLKEPSLEEVFFGLN
jgi:Cu-processing system ATP-binding protein